MMRSTRDRVIFADTGAFIALGNKRDQYHIRATRILDKLLDSPFTLITTRYVFAEAIALIRYMVGYQQAVETGNYMRDREDIEVIAPGVDTEAHAWEIFTKYADQDFSYVDCVSFAYMKERNITEAFAFDKHFMTMGFQLL